MSQPRQIDLNALWSYVQKQVQDRVTLPALWRGMGAAKPLGLEDDTLVLGFPVQEMHQSGLLMDNQNRNVIEQVLESATRKRLKIQVVQGDTPEDWEAHKRQQEEGKRLAEQSRAQHQAKAEAGGSWDAVGEQLIRQFSALSDRNLASIQARYLSESVEILAEAYGRLMPDTPTSLDERNYSRAVDRVAERVGVPAALIACMVIMRRA